MLRSTASGRRRSPASAFSSMCDGSRLPLKTLVTPSWCAAHANASLTGRAPERLPDLGKRVYNGKPSWKHSLVEEASIENRCLVVRGRAASAGEQAVPE